MTVLYVAQVADLTGEVRVPLDEDDPEFQEVLRAEVRDCLIRGVCDCLILRLSYTCLVTVL